MTWINKLLKTVTAKSNWEIMTWEFENVFTTTRVCSIRRLVHVHEKMLAVTWEHYKPSLLYVQSAEEDLFQFGPCTNKIHSLIIKL